MEPKRAEFRLSRQRKERFLQELAEHGVVARACRAASPHSRAGCIETFRGARATDEAFARAWDEAIEAAKGVVEYAIYKRGVEGVETSTGRRFSDRLLLARAAALMGEYRQAGTQVVQVVDNSERLRLRAGLEQLPAETRSELRAALERALGAGPEAES